jgi:hypothetical protein
MVLPDADTIPEEDPFPMKEPPPGGGPFTPTPIKGYLFWWVPGAIAPEEVLLIFKKRRGCLLFEFRSEIIPECGAL